MLLSIRLRQSRLYSATVAVQSIRSSPSFSAEDQENLRLLQNISMKPRVPVRVNEYDGGCCPSVICFCLDTESQHCIYSHSYVNEKSNPCIIFMVFQSLFAKCAFHSALPFVFKPFLVGEVCWIRLDFIYNHYAVEC